MIKTIKDFFSCQDKNSWIFGLKPIYAEFFHDNVGEKFPARIYGKKSFKLLSLFDIS